MQPVDSVLEPEIGYLLHHPYGIKVSRPKPQPLCATRIGDPRQTYIICLIRPINLPSQQVALRIGNATVRNTFFKKYEHIVFRVDRPLPRKSRIDPY